MRAKGTMPRSRSQRWAVLACLGLSFCAFAASPFGVPHPPQGHFATDTTGTIDSTTMGQLDGIGAEVDASGDGQLGIAIVDTTSGTLPRKFATDVFNRWGIGHRGADDGLLLFVALDDHKAEIVMGDGLGLCCSISSADTDVVMRDDVVANFKAHRTSQALIDGARALAALLHRHSRNGVKSPEARADPVSIEAEDRVARLLRGQLVDGSPRSWLIDLGEQPTPAAQARAIELAGTEAYADGKVALFFVAFSSARLDPNGVCGAAHDVLAHAHPKLAVICRDTRTLQVGARIDGVDGHSRSVTHLLQAFADAFDGPPDQLTAAARSFVSIAEHPVSLRSAQDSFEEVYDEHTVPFYAGLGVFGLFGGVWARRWNRYRSRSCAKCGRARQRLGAHSELEHLSDSQKREQELGSVDYDVWWCGVCHDAWINDNVAWFSSYSRCRSCGARARTSTTTTLEHATEWSGGRVEVKEFCESCNYTSTYTRRTAQLSSSSTSDWSSSSSSSSSSDFTSFDGGGSSGGGSSGSW